MIRWVREDAGLSIEDVARKAGTSEAVVRKWEDGSLPPTVRQLRLLANAAKRPLAIFYLAEPPWKFSALKDFRQFPGGLSVDPSPALRLAMRLAHERRQVAIDLARELDEVPPSLPVAASIGESVVAVSQRIREFLGVSLVQQRSWTAEYDALNAWRRAVQNRGVLVFQAPGVDVEEMRGFSSAESPMPIIVLNVKDAPNGRVFTLMHEFCHLLLRNGAVFDLQDREGESGSAPVEVFCNAVAGETLVPATALAESGAVSHHATGLSWDASQLRVLAREFSVSKEVVLRRLLDTGRITHAGYRARLREIRESIPGASDTKGGFAPPDVRVVSHLGRAFVRLVLVSCYQEKITTRDVSAYLGVRLKHLGKIEQKVMGSSEMFGWSLA